MDHTTKSSRHLCNLPQPSTSLIGREADLAEVKALVGQGRLVTLTGPGGCGKTRLGLQAGLDLLDQFADGVWLVELAPLRDAGLVAQTIATALGLREEFGRPMTSTLADFLKERTLLLVLDNCEHLADACARLAEPLLKVCSNLKLLTTSREPLGIGGELIWQVASLTTPDFDTFGVDRPDSGEALEQYAACRLFLERAGIEPAQINDADAGRIATLCAVLDGLPLAIELAAAQTSTISLENISAGVNDRFRSLAGVSPDAEPRQRTLQNLIDWSYNLLTEPERILFRRLSVFAGGWTLPACERICTGSGIEEFEILDLLTGLVNKSLVQFDEPDGNPRYQMLETIRQYCCELPDAALEAPWLRGRHFDYFVELTTDAASKLVGPAQKETLELLEWEHANLRAALQWIRTRSEDAEPALSLAVMLWRFWNMRGYFTDGRAQLNAALSLAGGSAKQRALALHAAGSLAWRQADYEDAEQKHSASLALFRELSDETGIGLVCNSVGLIAVDRGDYEAAAAAYEESLRLRRACGDVCDIANTLNNMGALASRQNDYDRARALYEESLSLFQSLGDKQGMALVYGNLGIVERGRGRTDAAWEAQQMSLRLRRELGDRAGIALALGNLGLIAYQRRDYETAVALQNESLALRRRLGDTGGVLIALMNLAVIAREQDRLSEAGSLLCECLELAHRLGNRKAVTVALVNLGLNALKQERPEAAVALWAAADAQRAAIGSPLPPGEQAQLDEKVEEARASLGAEAAGASWAAGAAMSLEQAVRYTLATYGAPLASPGETARRSGRIK